MHSPSTLEIGWYLFFCVLCGLLQSVIVGYFIYKYQKRKYLFKSSIEELRLLHETEILQSQLEIQEQTFSNISREIHDNIGQKLTLVKLRLNTLRVGNEEARGNIDESVRILGEVISDLSDLSRSMSSEMIMQNGLFRAVEFEVSQLSKSGIFDIGLEVKGDPVFLDVKNELSLFRIIQESLNNIIKHSKATVIRFSLHYEEDLLQIIISDNGQGFDIESISNVGSGLRHMRRRAEIMGGSFLLESNAENGTVINIKIPIYGNN
jgi:two-component system NarL family sensor kinase